MARCSPACAFLLVEDNATNRHGRDSRMLEALGARVTVAEDGAQGVAAARQRL